MTGWASFFWVTFLGAYLIFFPMHYLGLLGVPRRYHDIGEAAFIPATSIRSTPSSPWWL